jgi:hypothetical protein
MSGGPALWSFRDDQFFPRPLAGFVTRASTPTTAGTSAKLPLPLRAVWLPRHWASPGDHSPHPGAHRGRSLIAGPSPRRPGDGPRSGAAEGSRLCRPAAPAEAGGPTRSGDAASVGFVGLPRHRLPPDPQKHPAEPLPVVVGRVLDACAAGADLAGRCLVCSEKDWSLWRVCRNCGVASGGRGIPF